MVAMFAMVAMVAMVVKLARLNGNGASLCSLTLKFGAVSSAQFGAQRPHIQVLVLYSCFKVLTAGDWSLAQSTQPFFHRTWPVRQLPTPSSLAA